MVSTATTATSEQIEQRVYFLYEKFKNEIYFCMRRSGGLFIAGWKDKRLTVASRACAICWAYGDRISDGLPGAIQKATKKHTVRNSHALKELRKIGRAVNLLTKVSNAL